MAELKERISNSEFVQWRALYEVEGFGYRRLDILFATLQSLIANVNRSKDHTPYKPQQFIPDWWQAVEMAQIPLVQKFKMFTAAAGIENVNGQS